MKKLLAVLLMTGLLVGLVACELDDNESARDLRFDNASQHTVRVVSLAGEFERFNLGPSENIRLRSIEFPDYDWEPKEKVQVSEQSASRRVTFVNARRVPPIIVITNQP